VNLRRVWIIYRKELVEALRDRRTLITMILVPLLLYPVLMVIVVQALQIEKARQERETFRIIVPDAAHLRWLEAIFAADEDLSEYEPREVGEQAEPARRTSQEGTLHAIIRGDQFDVSVAGAPLEEWVRLGRADVGLVTDPPVPEEGLGAEINRTVRLIYDPAEYRSRTAYVGLQRILHRQNERAVLARLQKVGFEADLLSPLIVREHSVASPQKLGGALLGQILPFLIVIMTVTGAIYPAIDLTAGERERGTLETLMVAPVPTTQIVAGKFLVVTTIAIISAALNLASMGATIRFGGVAGAMMGGLPEGVQEISIPIVVLPIVLLAMVPFAVFFSAVMIATCSFARTFKEAQNYMSPVMIAALIPAMITSYMPSIRLTGAVVVMPVVNVIVLLRELFRGHYDIPAAVTAFAATCLYAAAAVMVAARLYGQEAVLFSDVGSYRTLLYRRFIRPRLMPTPSAALLLVAVIFPLSFYWQISMMTPDMSPHRMMTMTMLLMLGCFLAPTLAVAWYFKLDPRRTFSLQSPPGRAWLAALLIGLATPTLAQAVVRWQKNWLPASQEIMRALEEQQSRFLELPWPLLLISFALLPAVCEEFLFRGFLLSGLRTLVRPWGMCVIVGVVFGLFHTDLVRIPVVSLLGIVLAYVCWRGGSIFPVVFIHFLHNGLLLTAARDESMARMLGMTDESSRWIVPLALLTAVVGLLLIASAPRRTDRHLSSRQE
jgi:sodium transport system permease protein